MNKSINIILIDDNPADNYYHRIIIKDTSIPVQIIDFEKAREALNYLSGEDNPTGDIIFLDINMPEIDGFEFLKLYEEIKPANRSLIIMLSNSLRESDQAKALSSPYVVDYRAKPLTETYIKRIVEKYLA